VCCDTAVAGQEEKLIPWDPTPSGTLKAISGDAVRSSFPIEFLSLYGASPTGGFPRYCPGQLSRWKGFCSQIRQGLSKGYGLIEFYLNINRLANSISSWMMVCPILGYIFSVTSAWCSLNCAVVAWTRSTGTWPSGSLQPIKIGDCPKSPW